ncbi:MAG: RNase adapter RapZ [Caldimicrobium sp.]
MNLFLVLITGESGAGKSTALRAFEDLDYLAIDNFPIKLLFPFLEEVERGGIAKKVALVTDIRDPSFLNEFPKAIEELKRQRIPFEILYLYADLKVLITRFSQTRRPHPLLKEFKDLNRAIKAEKERLAFLKEYATVFIDSSQFNVHQLRHEIFKLFGKKEEIDKIILHLIAFGYKYGIPYEANYLFDARVLPNPYFVPELKSLSGKDEPVRQYLLKEPITLEFIERISNFIKWIIPLHQREGRKFVTIGIGCTGGRHRSPAIIFMLYERLKDLKDVEIVLTLRDVERDSD